MDIGIHITHEAVQKIGGIGSVIAGLITSDKYNEKFNRSILYGPLFDTEGPPSSRLGKDGHVLYSGIDGYDEGEYSALFSPVEKEYNIGIVYGKRTVVNESDVSHFAETETVLVYVNDMKKEPLETFKYVLWEYTGLSSEKFNEWDYEQYLRIAIPYQKILSALSDGSEDICYHFSHEYMGMPAILGIYIKNKKEIHKKNNDITIFYAHEVSTSRHVIENLPGRDISFYGILKHPSKGSSTMEDIFGSRSGFYRNELIKLCSLTDHIFAVGDLVKKELLFLNPLIDEKKIKTVYNGIPLKSITLDEKNKSRESIKDYCVELFNYRPDHIFTHITRLVESKGLWRDIMLLEELDKIYSEKGSTGFYLLLSTLIGSGRPSADIRKMEKEYGWPVLHRNGWPDLVGIEQDVYNMISEFNARSRSIKAVFINQFGFNRHSCGMRIPEKAEWIDLRRGSDAEFGMSVYEPFGIAQIETLQFGGLAVLSDACGCVPLVTKAYSRNPDSFQVVEFFGDNKNDSIDDLLKKDIESRKVSEKETIRKNSRIIFEKISNNSNEDETEQHLLSTSDAAKNISWERIVEKNLIQGLEKQ